MTIFVTIVQLFISNLQTYNQLISHETQVVNLEYNTRIATKFVR